MTKPTSFAAAVAVLSGIAAIQGWSHAIGAVVLLVAGMWLLQIVHRTRALTEKNGRFSTPALAHRLADLIVVVGAAVLGTPAARDLALEAQAMLDDMSVNCTASHRLVTTALRCATRFRSQQSQRAKSRVVAPEFKSSAADSQRQGEGVISTLRNALDSYPHSQNRAFAEQVMASFASGVLMMLAGHFLDVLEAPSISIVVLGVLGGVAISLVILVGVARVRQTASRRRSQR